MKCNETRHYKMYKAGKRILYASIAMIACGSWLFLSQDAHAAVTSNVSTTVNAPATGSANNSQLTDKNLGTAAGNTQTSSTSTQTEDPASKDLHTGDSGDASNQTSQEPQKLKTIDQLNNQYIDDKGNVSATKPVVTTGGSQKTDSDADMATNITGDLNQTHKSVDGSTYYTSEDGNFSGQGGQNKSDNRVAVSKPGEVGDNYGKVYRDASGKQWVKLVSDNTSVAASYSFKNQIDTTSGFDIQGEWSMSHNNPGGGLGVILQPVNPQVAGIGDNSDASIDIGIQNQPNTTFLGFDGYQSQYRDDHDTLPGQLTIRQTDGVARTSKGEYGGGFNQLNFGSGSVNADNPDGDNPYSTVYSVKEIDPFLGNPYLTTQAQQISDPLDMLFDINWIPDNGVKTATDETSGTLSVTVYNPDYPSYVAGKVVTSGTKLPKATSIALFGALGGDGKDVLAQGRITSFSLQQVSQQVTVNYIDSDTGEAVKPVTTINASVGNTLAVNETTTGNTANYGAPVIDGYAFVGAVGTDADGNYQLADGSKPEDVMQVVNTKTLSNPFENKTYNTINVYYKHTDTNSVTRTINDYTTPDKSKSPTKVIQSSFGHVIAVELNQAPTTDQQTTPIKDKDGHEIVLTAGSSAVPIQQVKGYTSGYSKNGDNTWTKAKEIPAIPQNGLDNNTYSVQYKADPQSVQVQLIDSDDNGQLVGGPLTVNGVTDGSQSYTIAIPANYELATGAQATGTVTFKAQDNADIQVKVKHQHAISTMTTTNTVTYTGLPSDVTLADGVATVNWNIDTDQVNQNISYMPTAKTSNVDTPKVDGYTANDSTIAFDNNESNIKPVNQSKNVAYTANHQSVQIAYVDDNNGGTVVDTPINLTGTTNSTVTWNMDKLPAGYQLADKKDINGTYTFTSAQNQTVDVHLTHVITNNQMTTTRTIDYVVNDSNYRNQVPEAQIQAMNWKITTDQATKQSIATSLNAYSQVTAPTIAGYTANNSQIAQEAYGSSVEASKLPANETVTVAYTADSQNAQVQYVDDDNKGASVGTPTSITGQTNGTITWSAANKLNYDLAKGQVASGSYTFKAADNGPIVIHLVHQHELGTATSINTVTYTGLPVTPENSVVTVNWNVDTDKVNNTTTYVPAKDVDKASTITVPEVDGYTANDSSVTFTNVQSNAQPVDQSATIAYTANAQSVEVQLIDSDDNNQPVGDPISIKGVTDGSQTYTVMIPANYELVTDTQATGTVTFKAKDNANIQIQVRHQHELSAMTTTNTVIYQGLPIDAKQKESATTVNWNVDTDKVNSNTTYAPTTDINESSTVTAPKVDGYTVNNSSVTFTNVQSNTQPVDQNETIIYTANSQSAQVQYVDDDNKGALVGTSADVTGQTNSTVTWKADKFTNYGLAKGQADNGSYIFKAADNGPVVVHLVHQHELGTTTSTDTVSYTGLPTDVTPKDSVVTVNWKSDTDKVNNTTTYVSATDVDKNSTVTAPEVDGYTANNSSVTFTNTQPADQNATIAYTANSQRAQVQYVDDDNNGTLVGTSADVTGQTNSTVTWKADKFTDYDLAEDQADNGSYTFKAANNAPVVIHLVHQHVLGTATSTDTVSYTGLPTNVTPKDSVVTVNWKTNTDQVNKQTTYIPDTAADETSTINAVAVDGYTAKNPSVTFTNAKSNARPNDQKQTITYTANPQNVQIRYIDDDNKDAVVSTSTGIAGQTDGTVAWTTTDKPAGYQLANKQAVNGTYTFTAVPKQTVDVHLTHVITNGHKTTTRTINYVVNDLNYRGQNPETQTQTMNWNTTTDQATGQSVATSANAYYQVVTPTIAGYTADDSQVAQKAYGPVETSKIPANETVTVTYKADSQNAQVQYVDDDNNGALVGMPTDITGQTNSTIAWDAPDKPNYDVAKGQVTSGSYTFKAAGNDPIIVHLVHQHAVSATTTTNTVTYQGLPANVKLADSAIIVNWTINTDKVNDSTTYTPATDADKTSTITAAIVEGYTADNLSVTFTNAKSNNKPEDQNKTITYTADSQAQSQAGSGVSVNRDDYYDYMQKGQLSTTDPQVRAEVPTDAPSVTKDAYYDYMQKGQLSTTDPQVRTEVPTDAPSVSQDAYYDYMQKGQLSTTDPQARAEVPADALSVSQDAYYDYTQKGQLSTTDPQVRAEVPTDAPSVSQDAYYDYTQSGKLDDGIQVRGQVDAGTLSVKPDAYYDYTQSGKLDDGIQVRNQVDAGTLSVTPDNYYDNTQTNNSADGDQVDTQTLPDKMSNDTQPTQVASDGLSVTSDDTQASRSSAGKPSRTATSVISDSDVTAVDDPGQAVGASDPVQSDAQRDTRINHQTDSNNDVTGQSKTVTGTNSVTSALTTKPHSTTHSQASIARNQLPQTNEQTGNRVLSQIGLSLMSLLFVLGIVDKRQKHDED
ncbi:mucin-binding protein [Secundilactobacillus hailunensis]|uniref:mucin-binding protein n=1 Tax=Secundilactobacillus hailunensis TaxID=2559923 RepID=UPI0014851DBB|nr:KxYKxGKxW signal peptide domain-containing protein [Secundilactobacillus hailunensis]